MKVLISQVVKDMKNHQSEAAEVVKGVGSKRKIRYCSAGQVRFDHRVWLDEGAHYWFFGPNGATLETHMVSESTMGAANDGVSYEVGKQASLLPAGTWIVCERLFLGRWMLSVDVVQAEPQPELETSKEV